MNERFDAVCAPCSNQRSDVHSHSSAAHSGTVRPRVSITLTSLLAQTLDEMDYGVVLLDDDLRVIHANHVARSDLCGTHPLQLHGQELRVRQATDQHPLEDALRAATRRGIRRLVSLGEGDNKVSVSVVPLSVDSEQRAPALMLSLGKRQLCANLSVQGFARMYRLSPGEEQVLTALCKGKRPVEVAQMHGVALSTIRTQITSIRIKTGTQSIHALVRSVSMLPPLVGALRHTTTQHELPTYSASLSAWR